MGAKTMSKSTKPKSAGKDAVSMKNDVFKWNLRGL